VLRIKNKKTLLIAIGTSWEESFVKKIQPLILPIVTTKQIIMTHKEKINVKRVDTISDRL